MSKLTKEVDIKIQQWIWQISFMFSEVSALQQVDFTRFFLLVQMFCLKENYRCSRAAFSRSCSSQQEAASIHGVDSWQKEAIFTSPETVTQSFKTWLDELMSEGSLGFPPEPFTLISDCGYTADWRCRYKSTLNYTKIKIKNRGTCSIGINVKEIKLY